MLYRYRPHMIVFISGFDTSVTDYTLECNRRLSFTTGTAIRCYSYNITNDDICELGMSQTVFKVQVTLSTAGDAELLVDNRTSITTVIIDDTKEPECSKSKLYARMGTAICLVFICLLCLSFFNQIDACIYILPEILCSMHNNLFTQILEWVIMRADIHYMKEKNL